MMSQLISSYSENKKKNTTATYRSVITQPHGMRIQAQQMSSTNTSLLAWRSKSTMI